MIFFQILQVPYIQYSLVHLWIYQKYIYSTFFFSDASTNTSYFQIFQIMPKKFTFFIECKKAEKVLFLMFFFPKRQDPYIQCNLVHFWIYQKYIHSTFFCNKYRNRD